MKLLFIKKKFSPYGGAEVYLKRVIEILDKNAEIHILTQSWPEDTSFIIHKLPSVPFFSDVFFAFQAKQFVQNHKSEFSLTISFDRTIYQTIYRASDGCHLRWLNQRRFINSFLKCLSFKINPHHLALKWLEKKCLKNSKMIIVNSKMVKKDYEYFYGKELSAKCIVCYNGVNLEKFSPVGEEQKFHLRAELGIPDGKIILFAGSGFERKGLIFLIKAMKLLPEDFKLVVLGKDKHLKHFQKLVYKLSLEKKILFLGVRKDIVRFYQMADVFVLPTIYDPFANVCLEAMACGLPVITTAANGVAEVIEQEKDGFVLDFPIDEKRLAFLIKETVANKNKMAQNARKKAENFSLEKAIAKIVNIIKNAHPSH
ncbi:MAG: glycosyltransferase family 4 protein [Candidatus Desulfofervidaceae bacterium]|nr:glycosyltransferase family 4 protein [Candidatus Desulfofervidaceae bacterium]